jgi:GNAT superfamily N-acetyltransferase
MAEEANVNAVVTVRLASADDADRIGRIQVETWRAAYTGLMPDEAIARFDIESRQRLWRAWFERPWPRSVVFVAELDGHVVGFANSGPCREEERAGELYAIYVQPDSWSTGAGRALIQHTEESLRSSGFGEAILWVLEGNDRAERFYRAAGWELDGRKVDEFQGTAVSELRYRKRL